MLDSVLEKCGQFVTHIDLEEFEDSAAVNEEFVNIITKKCPNLQEIDDGCQCFCVGEIKIDILMPIVDKLKRITCDFDKDNEINEINDEDLGKLLLLNKKLESFDLFSNEILNGTFFDAMCGDSIKELYISIAKEIPFQTICRVSKFFCNFKF